MVRKVDESKIRTIISCMKRHPEGTYVSQIARETKLSKSTVSYLLAKHLTEQTEQVITGKGGLFKIFKLKV